MLKKLLLAFVVFLLKQDKVVLNYMKYKMYSNFFDRFAKTIYNIRNDYVLNKLDKVTLI